MRKYEVVDGCVVYYVVYGDTYEIFNEYCLAIASGYETVEVVKYQHPRMLVINLTNKTVRAGSHDEFVVFANLGCLRELTNQTNNAIIKEIVERREF